MGHTWKIGVIAGFAQSVVSARALCRTSERPWRCIRGGVPRIRREQTRVPYVWTIRLRPFVDSLIRDDRQCSKQAVNFGEGVVLRKHHDCKRTISLERIWDCEGAGLHSAVPRFGSTMPYAMQYKEHAVVSNSFGRLSMGLAVKADYVG